MSSSLVRGFWAHPRCKNLRFFFVAQLLLPVLLFIVLRSLFSLYYFNGERHRFLRRG